MEHETHRIALVVFCEAEGVDVYDAAAGAQMALNRLIYNNAQENGHELVGQAGKPACAHCGVDVTLSPSGNAASHMLGETWSPEDFHRDNPDVEKPEACAGSGQPPRTPKEPVIGFVHQNGFPVHARVHQIMEIGMALGNGYLWAKPTRKAF